MKQSFMKPDQLKEAIVKLFGKRGISSYAKLIGKSNITVSRQLHGKAPVSETQAVLTGLLVHQHDNSLDSLL